MSASGCVLAGTYRSCWRSVIRHFPCHFTIHVSSCGRGCRDIPLGRMQPPQGASSWHQGSHRDRHCSKSVSCMCSISGAARHAWICATALARHAHATRRAWTLQSSCIMRQSEGVSNRCVAPVIWIVVAFPLSRNMLILFPDLQELSKICHAWISAIALGQQACTARRAEFCRAAASQSSQQGLQIGVLHLITDVSGSSHMMSCLNSAQVIAAHLTGMSIA